MENVVQDIRYALRQLGKNPGFTIVAAITLALGIGANTAVFSVIHSVLLKSLPYPDAQSLAVLNEYSERNGGMSVSWMDFGDWQTQASDFESMSVYHQRHFVFTGLDKPDQLRAGEVSSSFFSLLGMHPILGRTFAPEEDKAGATPTVVLSYGFWRSHLSGDSGIVNRTILLDGTPYVVVGVLPADFRFFQSRTDVYIPAALKGNDPNWLDRGNHQGYQVLARMRPGVSLAAARSSLQTIMKRLQQQYPASNDGINATVMPLYESMFGRIQTSLWVLLAASLRSEEHTSELQSRRDLVCRLLLEKKKKKKKRILILKKTKKKK